MDFKSWLEATYVQGVAHRTPLDALNALYRTYNKADRANLVCTFTQIDKVGLNPQSRYNTPLGIYLYPIEYVLQRDITNVPFAGDSPYLHVCKFAANANILHCHEATIEEPEDPADEIWFGQDGFNQIDRIKSLSDKRLPPSESMAKYLKKEGFDIRSNYSALWLTAMLVADKNPVKWNKVFRQVGVDGFVDHGTGTIHPNEETQAVVFDKSKIELVKTIDNRKHAQRPKPDWKLRTILRQLNPMSTQSFKTVISNVFSLINYLQETVTNAGTSTIAKNWIPVKKITDEIAYFTRRYKNALLRKQTHPNWQRFYSSIIKTLESLTTADYRNNDWNVEFQKAKPYLDEAIRISKETEERPI